VLLGRPMYSYVTPWPQYLPFTYPPFAALLATVLSVGSDWHDAIAWTVGEVLCTAGITYLGFRRLLPRFGRWAPLALGVLAGAVSWLEPFRDEIHFGQVDELLALMCAADLLLARTRWPRGVLVGLAAAIKLTPGVFIPYLWFSGQRRTALTAAGTFVGASVFTAIVLPQASAVYFLQDIFQPQRTGNVAGTSNQSLRGITERMHLPWHVGTVLWVIALLIVAWVGYRRAVRAHRAGQELTAVGITGLLAVLLSPIAWVHHMAWLPLVIGAIVADGRDRRRVAAGLLLFAFFAPSLPFLGADLMSHGAWAAPLGWLLQSSFGLAAIALVCLVPVHHPALEPVPLRRRRPTFTRMGGLLASPAASGAD
jgi:alpha-1,2-mannosyltransferase